jgi:hypothetical protein
MPLTTSREIKSFKDLRVWQEAIELVQDVYALCAKLPKEETYGLVPFQKRLCRFCRTGRWGHSVSYR